MKRHLSLSLTTALLIVGAVAVGSTTQGRPDTVSGTLTRTFQVVADTDLTGDVTCAVADGTPCFAFVTPDVQLRLNGYTITGRGDAATGCGGTVTAGEVGVSTNARNNVTVRGPGLIQRFRHHGVLVTGSVRARVEGLTVSTNCGSGIFVLASSFDATVEGNTSLRNGSSVAGLACGGIWLAGHNSRVRLNNTYANGYSNPPDDFGIGLVGAASGNQIDDNVVTGNTNGIYIAATVGANAVRDNTVLGNPTLQVGNAQPETRALDIVNLSPDGRTTFQRNQCLTALNAPCPAVAPR